MKQAILAVCAVLILGGAPVRADSQQTLTAGPAALDSTIPGDLQCSGPINHRIQNNFEGTSVKWETGEVIDGQIAGLNFNPYALTGKLSFYWLITAGSVNAGVATWSGGNDWRVLRADDQVGPDSVFSNAVGMATNWTSGVNGYLGFKFACSTAETAICYGYAHITSTGPQGFPATLVNYCFDRAGAAVTIPQEIFRSSFEKGEGIITGVLNHGIQNSIDGTSVKWETGEVIDGELAGLNFNPYDTYNNKLGFYWGDSSSANAGVAATATSVDYLVLKVGDRVGPSSVFLKASAAAENWIPGVDGYLGFKFACSTAAICYGYVRIITTGPNGFPAVMLDYAYNSAGNAVTIP